MAVPSSGQLRLRADIANEVDGSATGTNVSLQALSRSAGKSTPDGMLEFYGYSSSTAPIVSTSSSSYIKEYSMRINGSVSSDGGASITERGFYFGRSTNMTSNSRIVVSGTTGNYLYDASSLVANANYYIWAFATNSQGTTYGARVTARTAAIYTPTYATYSSYNATDTISLYGNSGTHYHNYNQYYVSPTTGTAFIHYSHTETICCSNYSSSQHYYPSSSKRVALGIQNIKAHDTSTPGANRNAYLASKLELNTAYQIRQTNRFYVMPYQANGSINTDNEGKWACYLQTNFNSSAALYLHYKYTANNW